MLSWLIEIDGPWGAEWCRSRPAKVMHSRPENPGIGIIVETVGSLRR